MTSRKHPSDMAEPAIEPCPDIETLQRRLARRRSDLRNPRYADPRRFPVWRKGMTTAQYIGQYTFMNQARKLVPWSFTHADRAAPWNEEADA